MTPEIQSLLNHRQPLPAGTRIRSTAGGAETGGTHELSEDLLASANRVPNSLSADVPFWILGWKDLHDSLRADAALMTATATQATDDGTAFQETGAQRFAAASAAGMVGDDGHSRTRGDEFAPPAIVAAKTPVEYDGWLLGRLNQTFAEGQYVPGRRLDEALDFLAIQTTENPQLLGASKLGYTLMASEYGRQHGRQQPPVAGFAHAIKAAINGDAGPLFELRKPLFAARVENLLPERWMSYQLRQRDDSTVPEPAAVVDSAVLLISPHGTLRVGGDAPGESGAVYFVPANAATSGRRFAGMAAALRRETDELFGYLPRVGVGVVVVQELQPGVAGEETLALGPACGSWTCRETTPDLARQQAEAQRNRLVAAGYAPRVTTREPELPFHPYTVALTRWDGDLARALRQEFPGLLVCRETSTPSRGEFMVTGADHQVLDRLFAACDRLSEELRAKPTEPEEEAPSMTM